MNRPSVLMPPTRNIGTVAALVVVRLIARNGPMLEKAELNSDSVGLKANLGGHVSAADSGLNAVMTIHSTGRKNAMATTQPSTVQPTRPGHWRILRVPAREVVARDAARSDKEVIPVPPRI